MNETKIEEHEKVNMNKMTRVLAAHLIYRDTHPAQGEHIRRAFLRATRDPVIN